MKREPETVAEVVEAVHRGRIGHSEAMRKLGLATYHDLVDTMHANGLSLWAHRAAKAPSAELVDILSAACAKPGDRR